jgi:hypothetical protein
MSGASSKHHQPAGAPTGARRALRKRLRYLAVLAPLLAACETGSEVVSNSVTQCIAHIKLPAQYGEPYCRCLGEEMEQTFSHAQIRQYRLETDNWTYFAGVADDAKLMRINRICIARHVPEQFR